MAQTREVRGVNTSIRHEDGRTVVRYHSTDVVEFTADRITLRTGGWFTVTTKCRMNQASNQFGLGFSVYSEGGTWFVRVGRGLSAAVHPFDGDTFVIDR